MFHFVVERSTIIHHLTRKDKTELNYTTGWRHVRSLSLSLSFSQRVRSPQNWRRLFFHWGREREAYLPGLSLKRIKFVVDFFFHIVNESSSPTHANLSSSSGYRVYITNILPNNHTFSDAIIELCNLYMNLKNRKCDWITNFEFQMAFIPIGGIAYIIEWFVSHWGYSIN